MYALNLESSADHTSAHYTRLEELSSGLLVAQHIGSTVACNHRPIERSPYLIIVADSPSSIREPRPETPIDFTKSQDVPNLASLVELGRQSWTQFAEHGSRFNKISTTFTEVRRPAAEAMTASGLILSTSVEAPTEFADFVATPDEQNAVLRVTEFAQTIMAHGDAEGSPGQYI